MRPALCTIEVALPDAGPATNQAKYHHDNERRIDSHMRQAACYGRHEHGEDPLRDGRGR
mgnify:CR=1 FL=1